MNEVITQYLDWDQARPYLGLLLRAFWVTIQISLLAEVLCLVLGLILALMRRARVHDHRVALPPRPEGDAAKLRRWRVACAARRAAKWGARGITAVVRGFAVTYINVFRGVPALLVLLLMAGSFPFLPIPVVSDLTVFQIGVIGLGLVYAAYIAEVYRAGIDSVDRGQYEAARSLGMSHMKSMRLIVLPQAVRRVLPPLMNDYIALTKDVALVGVLAVSEVVAVARDAQSVTFNSSALTLAALLYLVYTLPLVWVLDRVIARQQRRSGRGEIITP